MFACTLLGAAGQILIKIGAAGSAVRVPWTTLAGAWANLFAMASNPFLIGGYSLYAVMTVLFVVTLRDEELSVVYPIIALTYVWVAGLSVLFFQEHMNPPKVFGILLIVAGVGVLGRSGAGKI
jgi:multidrug transporter EmrE-like cation transporter